MLHISCIIILKCTFSFYCASYLFLRRKIFNLLLRKITFDFCSAIWIRKSVNDFHVPLFNSFSLSLMISLVVKQSNVNILFLEFWLNLEKNMCFHYIFFISCAWIFHDDHFVFFLFHVHFSWSLCITSRYFHSCNSHCNSFMLEKLKCWLHLSEFLKVELSSKAKVKTQTSIEPK